MEFRALKWIFLDLGSTLIDETESYKGWFQNASDAIGGKLSPKEIKRVYMEGMANYTPTIAKQLQPYGYTGSTAAPLYPSELEYPYPQAKPLLERLSVQYKLGVVANQVEGVHERLTKYGLLSYFAFVLGSHEVGFSKPDPRIFHLALDKAGCAPQEAMMIGDRPDNDIYPAKQMGIRTIRVRQGAAAVQHPRSPEYEADRTVENLDELSLLLF